MQKPRKNPKNHRKPWKAGGCWVFHYAWQKLLYEAMLTLFIVALKMMSKGSLDSQGIIGLARDICMNCYVFK
jgi:hypothetical protein